MDEVQPRVTDKFSFVEISGPASGRGCNRMRRRAAATHGYRLGRSCVLVTGVLHRCLSGPAAPGAECQQGNRRDGRCQQQPGQCAGDAVVHEQRHQSRAHGKTGQRPQPLVARLRRRCCRLLCRGAGLLRLLLLRGGFGRRLLLRHAALGAHAFATTEAFGSLGFNADHGEAEKQGNC